MKKIDFHTHTTASDGIYSPSQLVDLAVRNGLVALAVTDHDTIDGLAEAVRHAGEAGLKLYCGVEFSINYDLGSFHLIGLNIDYTNADLGRELKWLAERRGTRAYRIIEDLEKHGISIPIDEVLALSGGGVIGRPHIARVMVSHGYAPSIKEIFASYLVKGKPGYVKKERIELDAAISLIENSGGIPVIAHPNSLECRNLDEFEDRLKKFIKAGVRGIEAYAAMHTLEQAGQYARLARRYNLVVTGGSDFHGDKDETLGDYIKEGPIPLEIYDQLEKYIRITKK
jgi:3',5'-nucleoside bisphosphate phosphatase